MLLKTLSLSRLLIPQPHNLIPLISQRNRRICNHSRWVSTRRILVNLSVPEPGVGVAVEGLDFEPLPRSIAFAKGVTAQTIVLKPYTNTSLLNPVLATLMLQPGPNYTIGPVSNASVVIYPSTTPSGTGLTGDYYRGSSSTYSSSTNFNPTNLVLTRLDQVVDFTWSTNTAPITNNSYWTVRWTGQVQPEFSEMYTFVANTDDGVKLWVTDQLIIDKWVSQSLTEWSGSIDFLGDVRYNIRMEYFTAGSALPQAHLAWYSPSQVKQVIPAARLYPATASAAPSAVTSPMTAVSFVGQPFSYTIQGANSPTFFSASGLPPGLIFNSTNGLISGIPTLAGQFQVMLAVSNSLGLVSSVLILQVFDNASAVTRELWTGVPGINISEIPVSTPASLTNLLNSLEGITDFGDNYGERISGFLTAPTTGNYYFWIAGSDSAELWISNDNEPVNKVRRAYVSPLANPSPPPTNGSQPRQWNLQGTRRSSWLALVAGQRYYLEVLHKAGEGAVDNFAVGWLLDPIGTNTQPAGIVPSYLLSPYFVPPPAYIPGTLYNAKMLAQGASPSSAMGSATLRLSTDEKTAVLKFSYSGLSSPVTGEHIHSDPYLDKPIQVIFDIDQATPQPDGSYLWIISPGGTLTAADIVEIIKEGKAFINVHTVSHPGGEIRGNFSLANGAMSFTPPPPPPAWNDDHADPNAASRFLIQSTFGPSPDEIAAVQTLGYEAWIEDQFNRPPSYHLPYVLANVSYNPTTPYPNSLTYNSWWQQSVSAPDQLRQRVAFALSEIMVVSAAGILQNNARALSDYYDMLLDNAFGNFRTILESVTLSPAMGLYLDMRGNDKGSFITGLHPNENYAREILQLFSIGLYRMWPDGTLVIDSKGNLVPTYDQNVILGYARVFTGWTYNQPNRANGRLPTNFTPGADYTNAMKLVPTHHELGTKRILDNAILPAATGPQVDPAQVAYDYYGLQDLAAGLDAIFYNQNVGPFICRQLIQRLVTSHPSREYLYRVVQKFNDNGSGVRGDMHAVIKAILLDYEARSAVMINQPTFGKQREPLLRVTAPARAFPPPAPLAGTYMQTGTVSIVVTTDNPHRLSSGDTVSLNFTSGAPLPTSRGYSVANVTTNSFTVSAGGLVGGTYGWTNNTITVTASGHGLLASNPVYVVFTTGPATNGLYQVDAVLSTSRFTILAPGIATNSGNCLFPKISGGYRQSGTTITVGTSVSHSLNPGDTVFIDFTSGTAVDGQYPIGTVPDPTHFTVTANTSASQTGASLQVFPLLPPPLVRSGTVTVSENTWSMGSTDADISQTPLRSPTVFNFFFPDYKFPGILAANGLTTPEFQLTSDTSVAMQLNFLYNGIASASNTKGFSSFKSGNGSLVMDLGPYMTPDMTSNSGIPALVDSLNTLLMGGQLSGPARTAIINYVASTNLPYGSPPSNTEMRNRVRAALHLVITSPDYTIQK